MSLGLIKKSSLALSLLTATCAYAQVDMIPCPSISNIQQTAEKIDAVIKVMGRYSVHTNANVIFENNIAWSVSVIDITAHSSDDALVQGKKALLQASLKEQEYATVLNPGQFSCSYGPSKIKAYGFQQ